MISPAIVDCCCTQTNKPLRCTCPQLYVNNGMMYSCKFYQRILKIATTALCVVPIATCNTHPSQQGKETGLSDHTLHAYSSINSFLCAFIQHSFRQLDYVVRVRPPDLSQYLLTIAQDKLFIGSCLGLTPEASKRGVFYSDDGQSFSNVFFYGNEVCPSRFTVTDMILPEYTIYVRYSHFCFLRLCHQEVPACIDHDGLT